MCAVIFFFLCMFLGKSHLHLMKDAYDPLLLGDVVSHRTAVAALVISAGAAFLILTHEYIKRVSVLVFSGLVLTGICILFSADALYDREISKLLLNEVSTRSGVTQSGEEYGDYIELFNGSDMDISLAGSFLGIGERRRVALGDEVIKAHSCLVLKADKKDEPGHIESKLGSQGEILSLISPEGRVISSVSVPELKKGEVYARISDTDGWSTALATPGEANTGMIIPGPAFSAESGFYDMEFMLELSAPEGCSIYYTTDGSVPTTESVLYDSPVMIRDRSGEEARYRDIPNVVYNWQDTDPGDFGYHGETDICTVIRAMVYKEGEGQSGIVTKSYFVNMPEYEDISVISITTDPEELFGDDGIYVTGKTYDDWYLNGKKGDEPEANFTGNREIKAHLEYFDSDASFEQDAGLRIKGKKSRRDADKRLALYARPNYSGRNVFDRDILGYPVHSLLLRNDYTAADVIINELIDSAGTDIAVRTGRKAAVFLEGELWYYTYIRPGYSEQWVSGQYGVDRDKVIMSDAMPREIYDFLNSHDMSSEEDYKGLCELIDTDNYIDFISANIFFCNMDIYEDKDFISWKADVPGGSGYEDGRWRFLLKDMDNLLEVDEHLGIWAAHHCYEVDSFRGWRIKGTSYDSDRVFSALKKNPQFRQRFADRFHDLVNNRFTPDASAQILEKYGADEHWMDDFLIHRREYILPYMEECFGLTKEEMR